MFELFEFDPGAAAPWTGAPRKSLVEQLIGDGPAEQRRRSNFQSATAHLSQESR